MSEKKEKKTSKPLKVVLYSYPDTLFFYPSIIAGFIIWAIQPFLSTDVNGLLGLIFLTIFAFNFIVVTFDVSLGRTVIFILAIFILVLLYLLFGSSVSDGLGDVGKSIDPAELIIWMNISAQRNFYLAFSLILSILLLFAFLSARFSYWIITPQNLGYKSGIMGEYRSYGNPKSASIYEEVNDIFERLLFLSGNIIIHPANEKKSFRVKNVFNVDAKEKAIRTVLSYTATFPSAAVAEDENIF